MDEQRLLAVGRWPLTFVYCGERRYLQAVHALGVRIGSYVTDVDRKYRVTITARDLSDNNRTKSYLSDRIVHFFDPETGEVFENVDERLAEMIRDAGGKQPVEWPQERLRRREIDVTFDKNGFAEGWFFGVRSAFRSALDIIMETAHYKETTPDGRKRTLSEKFWSQGTPPAYSFSVGDMVYAPALPDMPWSLLQPKLSHTVQVVEATPDRAEGRLIIPGAVTVNIRHHRSGQLEMRTTTQAALVDMLRTGAGLVPTETAPTANEVLA